MGGVVSSVKRLFTGAPDECNDTNADIQKYLAMKAESEADAAEARKKAVLAAQGEAEAKKAAAEALQKELQAKIREAETTKRLEKAILDAKLAQIDRALAEQRGDKIEELERKAKEKEAEAKILAEQSAQALLDAKNRENEAHASMLETQKLAAEARAAADQAQKREAKVQEDLRRAQFYLKIGIQPEVWPTEEEFDSAKNRIQYDPEKIHFAVCGSSGSGKSSLVNAFRGLKNNGSRGLKNNSFEVAPTGVVETTLAITRYPDPRKEIPYNRLVWFDCPGAGTLEIPGWQYFNQQGLFIFDIIILVYDSRFTQIDVSIIQNAERFKIPLFVVRSKADVHIRNIMQDLGYDENDEDADDDHYEDCQAQAQRLLIDSTKNNLEKNLEKAELPKHDVFIVSGNVIYSLITGKRNKKTKKTTPEIDEARLIQAVLKRAHERRYGTQAPAKNHSILVKDKTARDLVSPHEDSSKIGFGTNPQYVLM